MPGADEEEHVTTHAGLPHASPAGWNVDTLRAVMQDAITEMRRWTGSRLAAIEAMSDIRFEESDKRYEQRFQAEQLALKDALVAQEKAVSSALLAADRAVSKAELAAERRFEAVNEFRGQLADQAQTFLPRVEFDAQHSTVVGKIDDLTRTLASSAVTQIPRAEVEARFTAVNDKQISDYSRLDEKIGSNTSAINVSHGRGLGIGQIAGVVLGGILGLCAIAALVVSLVHH